MEAGQKMSWDELARENAQLKADRERIVIGMGTLFPNSGWTLEPHPELGDMPEEFVSSLLSQVERTVNERDTAKRTSGVHEAKRLLAEQALKGSEEARLATEKKLALAEEQSTVWKTRLVEETERLREYLKNEREAGIQTRQAAGVAVAMATLRSARAREFMEPENLAKVWYDKYREDVIRTAAAANTRPTYPPASTIMDTWETLPVGSRTEIIGIAREVFKVFTDTDEAEGQKLDAVTESVMAEGHELATAVKRLQVVSEVLQHVWNAGVLPGIRALSAAGMEILPPGTIVHGVRPRPSTNVHRPE